MEFIIMHPKVPNIGVFDKILILGISYYTLIHIVM